MALWKLKPANDEPINPLADFPRKYFAQYQSKGQELTFIRAIFLLSLELAQQTSQELGFLPVLCTRIQVERLYSGQYVVRLPMLPLNDLLAVVIEHLQMQELNHPQGIRQNAAKHLLPVLEKIVLDEESTTDTLFEVISTELDAFEYALNTEDEALLRHLTDLRFLLQRCREYADCDPIEGKLAEKMLENIPSLLFYSDYGNLDSEIYLPHVVENLERKDLSFKEKAKVRTLKVLFDLLGMQPQAMLPTEANAQNLKKHAQDNRQKEVLLQAASQQISEKFNAWWRQSRYKFRFQNDGFLFRIWVSDELRQEEVELENRSRGLQWFFSFFLVFLTESKAAYSNCILLLDEAGLSLHPLAQRDLLGVFTRLSVKNQIIYTTHSPFLVDSSRLVDAGTVYVNQEGYTSLNYGYGNGLKQARKSMYPLYSALNAQIMEALTPRVEVVLVEGSLEQIVLLAFKNALIRYGLFRPLRDVLFVPFSHLQSLERICSLLGLPQDEAPLLLLLSKPQEADLAWLQSKYREQSERFYAPSAPNDYNGWAGLFPESWLKEELQALLEAQEVEAKFKPKDPKNSLTEFEQFQAKQKIEWRFNWQLALVNKLTKRLEQENDAEILNAILTNILPIFKAIPQSEVLLAPKGTASAGTDSFGTLLQKVKSKIAFFEDELEDNSSAEAAKHLKDMQKLKKGLEKVENSAQMQESGVYERLHKFQKFLKGEGILIDEDIAQDALELSEKLMA